MRQPYNKRMQQSRENVLVTSHIDQRAADPNRYGYIMKLKSFNRFSHSGVKRELVQLKRELSSISGVRFGSSGDGELTAVGENFTVYARKYKAKDGWRVVTCRGAEVLSTEYPKTLSAVLRIARKALR